METPAFEEWLMRQDVPLLETTTIEKYQDYLVEELGMTLPAGEVEMSPLQRKVTTGVWRARYNILPELGIQPFTRHYEVKGEPFEETRYGIMGYPGSWGRERMYEIAITKAEELRQFEWVRWLKEKRERE